MALLKYFKTPGLSPAELSQVREKITTYFGNNVTIEVLDTENCIYIDTNGQELDGSNVEKISWLFRETFEPQNFSSTSFLDLNVTPLAENSKKYIFAELGPRLNFSTAWSTNAINIFRSCGLQKVQRIEQSRRLLIRLSQSDPIDADTFQKIETQFIASLYDRMTEMIYRAPLTTFKLNVAPENWFKVPVMEQGRAALEKINKEMGLAFDDWDLDYYTQLFKEKIQRDPTSVECFDLSQSNSEHSRHWFFKGKMVIDGEEKPFSLFDMVVDTLKQSPSTNSLIAFRDNARAIKGSVITQLKTSDPTTASQVEAVQKEFALTFTAETHNFPTGIAPFPGAETGTGGRLRDTHCVGRGALVIAGTAGYSVGNLNIPNYPLPWEDNSWSYPSNMAKPLQIEIDASNGASDYGNKFGEPLIVGFTRSLGIKTPNGERREYIKPIMFTGGFGQMSAEHLQKGEPEVGMVIVKLGGPAYRIGIGGGAASSMAQGQNDENLDFNAVQRGDAEMESKLNRVIRACVELGPRNPIISIHDQGAGGNGNVLKEIVEPTGAKIEIRKILVGDETLSVLEIWGAEYQEADALLIKPEDMEFFSSLCQREGCPVAYVGTVTGDGRVVVHDEKDDSKPFDLELDHVLGKMPSKTFTSKRVKIDAKPLSLNLEAETESDHNVATKAILDRVLRLLSVGSKRFLTSKVDRCVSGLVAQQQCVGPLHIPLANNAVIAQSYFGLTGGATSIGEQPLKTLLNPAAMARMTVAEALCNLIFTKVSSLQDVKCSANWMWPAKLEGEGAAIFDAAQGLHDVLVQLGVAIDGGKDSLSMAAKVTHPDNTTEMVKAPGTLVLSTNCSVPDITKKITPDIKAAGESKLIFVNLSDKQRLGCTALAQVYNQLGDACPDFENVALFKAVWEVVQQLIGEEKLLAGHDRSDGGLMVTLLEMAFTGDCGLNLTFDVNGADFNNSVVPFLFNEELGLVFEVHNAHLDVVVTSFKAKSVPVVVIGDTTVQKTINFVAGKSTILRDNMVELRDIWEATSFELEMRQKNPKCIVQEKVGLKSRKAPPLKLSFTPKASVAPLLKNPASRPRIAVLREEGSNGDREMIAAWHMAGFDVFDVKMSDFTTSNFSLKSFRGVAFVGGFSYADVLGSAKGWAGVTRFNEKTFREFNEFYSRKDTFSLGVCNGCQLMALLGWVPYGKQTPDEKQPRFIRNLSEHFESRFAAVKILPSPAIMLKGMEGSTLGIWVAHGEGRAYFPDQSIFNSVIQKNLAPVRYVDDDNNHTEQYPFNPNGSPLGIASLCSEDGRHLAIMPHPERCFLKWQLPWLPSDWKSIEASPWLQIFQNARIWCDENAV